MSTVSMADNSSSEKIRNVAKYQRWIIIALLANIALTIFAFAAGGAIASSPGTLLVFRLVALAVVVFMFVSVMMLARQFTNIVLAVLCGILIIIPLVSLLVLLIFNQKATKYLREHGVRVGFFGVNPNNL